MGTDNSQNPQAGAGSPALNAQMDPSGMMGGVTPQQLTAPTAGTPGLSQQAQARYQATRSPLGSYLLNGSSGASSSMAQQPWFQNYQSNRSLLGQALLQHVMNQQQQPGQPPPQ
jgi:hypothetical protein